MTRSDIRFPVLPLTLLMAVACQQPAADARTSGCAADPAVAGALDDIMDRHVAAHYARDPVAAAADYTEDVWFRGDDGMELRSRETMESLYEQMYQTMRLVDFRHDVEEVIVCGDAAHSVGHYTETIETAGEQTSTRYNYMLLWRLQGDGSWKISRGTLVAVPPVS